MVGTTATTRTRPAGVIALYLGRLRAAGSRAVHQAEESPAAQVAPGLEAETAVPTLRWLPLAGEMAVALDRAADLEEIVISLGRLAEQTSGCARAILFVGTGGAGGVESVEVSLPSGALTRTAHAVPEDRVARVLDGAGVTSRGGEAVLPLTFAGKILGAVSVVGNRERRDLAVLEVAADHIARSIVLLRERVRRQAAEAKLQRQEEARVDFLTCVSHELRTPLASVVGFTQMLDRRWEALSEDQRREFVGRITAGARELHDLIDGSDLQRLGLLDPCRTRRPVDLRSLAVSATAAAGAVQAKVEVPDGWWASVDSEAFVAILHNILEGADEGEPPGEVVVMARRAQEEIQVGVAGGAATGRLGIAKARRGVAEARGRLWLEFSAERGRSVWFSLPAADQAEVRTSRSDPPPPEVPPLPEGSPTAH